MEPVTTIIAHFKEQREALVAQAMADEIEGLVCVFYKDGDMGMQAFYDKDLGEFVELIANWIGEPLPGQPGVIYTITPPVGEKW
ncbi:MAG: hypothetical protein IPN38_05275 [Flavobacteriales bacterium]|nr:hypothetical protein [Flavobacteriales bacterium]